MRRLLSLVAVFALLALPARAQNPAGISGTISAAGADCSVATRCVILSLGSADGTGLVTVTTFTGTIALEVSQDNNSWSAPQAGTTSITTPGTYAVALQGARWLRARSSILSSGTPTVTLSATAAPFYGSVAVTSAALPTGAATETTLAGVKTGTDRIPALGQAVSGSSLPVVLPAAQITTLTPPPAITNYANETGGNLAAIKADVDKIPALGQALAAGSVPVVLTASQISTLTPLTSVTANLGTLNGAATDASVTGLEVAQGSTTSGQKGILGLGAVTTSAPTYTNGQSAAFSFDTAGNLRTTVTGGGSNAAASAVGSAVPAQAGYTGVNVGGTLRGASGLSVGSIFPITVAVVDTSGNQVGTFGGAGGTASNYTSAFPSSGTAVGYTDGTNMQGARVFDGDSGAGTQYVLGTNLRKIASGGSVEAGTATDPLRVDPTGSTTQPVSAASLPLPTGAATLAEQQTQTTALQLIDNLPVAQGSTTSGQSGVLGQAAVTTAAPTYTTAQTSPLSQTTKGGLRVSPEDSGGTDISDATAHAWKFLPVDTTGAAIVPSTLATQDTALTVATTTGGVMFGRASAAAPTNAGADDRAVMLWLLRSGAAAVQPTFGGVLSSTGTGAVGTGTQRIAVGTDTATIAGSAPGTAGTASSNVLTVQGIASMTALKVDGSAVTQPVSGTVTANAGTGNFTVVQSTGSNLHMVCDSGCSSSTAPADGATFTPGTTPQSPIGGFFQTTATNNALTNGQMGAWQFTANRAGFVNLRNAIGTELGVAAAPLQVSLANTGSNATAVKVDGSAVTQPVSGTFWQATQPVSIAATVTVDSELPAAAASADGASNPTAPFVQDAPSLFNGTTWDRTRSAVNALNSTGTGIAASQLIAQFDDTSPTTITENQFGNLRMSAKRNLYTTIRSADGQERGVNVSANNALVIEGIGGAGVVPVSLGNGSPVGSATLSGVTANTTGTQVDLSGQAVVQYLVNCAGCDNSTMVTFQASDDSGANWTTVRMAQVGGTTIAASTTTPGVTRWQMPAGLFGSFRANVSNYSTGTVTVTVNAVNTGAMTQLVNANAIPYNSAGVETGTALTPFRVDPIGATAQPIRFAGGAALQNASNTWGFTLRGSFNRPVTSTADALDVNIKNPAQDPCAAGLMRGNVPISQTGTTLLVQGSAGRRIFVCHARIIAAAAETGSFIEGQGTSCQTNTLAVTGSTTAANGESYPATGGINDSGYGSLAMTSVPGNNLCLAQAGSNRLSGNLTYVQ